MANRVTQEFEVVHLDPVLEIEGAGQYILKRNWKFFWVPVMILIFLLINLGWEILRTYMPASEWPWKFTLLGINPAATLSGVFGSLLLAREQFARTMKPNLSWSTHYVGINSLNASAWVAYLMNAGPGTANIKSVKYSVKIRNESATIVRQQITSFELTKILHQSGLQEGCDFHLRLITKGTPLPPAKKLDESIEFAGFKPGVFEVVQKLNFHVVVVDGMGDQHIKSLPFVATLPNNFKTVRADND